MSGTVIMIIVGVVMLAVLGGISLYSQNYSLNIKDKTVGNGQHGTARWATGCGDHKDLQAHSLHSAGLA